MTHTPTPYRQGVLLMTRNVQNMSKDWQEKANYEESIRIFSGFISADEGRSRVAVALCNSPEDAEFIVRACNAYDDLTAQFQSYSIALDRAKREFPNSGCLQTFEEFYIEELVKAKIVNDKDA